MKAWPLKLELWLASPASLPLVLAVLGVLAAALWGALLPMAEQRSAQEISQLEGLRRTAAIIRPVEPLPPRADTLTAFEERLASDEDLSRLMQQIWNQGAAAGLQMNKVDYHSEVDASGHFNRLLITLPMTGPYPAVRKFTFSLMAAFPGLSLDKLDMKREQIASGDIETTSHLTLYTRP